MQMSSMWLERTLAQISAGAPEGVALQAALRDRVAAIDSEFASLQAKLNEWAAAHAIDIAWTDTPGRRTHKRNCRVILEPDQPNRDALYDALDAEIRRLILEEPNPG